MCEAVMYRDSGVWYPILVTLACLPDIGTRDIGVVVTL